MSAAAQRAAVTEFVSTTMCTPAQAKRFLQAVAWNVNSAVNAFFESGEKPQGAPAAPPAAAGVDAKKIEKEFERLAGDAGAESLMTDGLLNLATELDVDLENL